MCWCLSLWRHMHVIVVLLVLLTTEDKGYALVSGHKARGNCRWFQGYLSPCFHQEVGVTSPKEVPRDWAFKSGNSPSSSAWNKHAYPLYADSIEMGHSREVLRRLMRGIPYNSNDETKDIRQFPEVKSSRVANELWEELKHRFPAVPKPEDFSMRIANAPITKITINDCEIEVRQPGLGLPWFIDDENRAKFIKCFEPGSLEDAVSKMDISYYKLPSFSERGQFLPLPGVPAAYLPHIKIIEYRTDIEGYEYVAVLHDSKRDYTWTYETSKKSRAKSYDGRGPLELFELTSSGIKSLNFKDDSKYKAFTPLDYFNVPKDVTMFFPRKPLDKGIFRLPKLDDVMNIKMRNINRDHALKVCKSAAPFGYLQLKQNFWKTVKVREHPSGSLVQYRRLGNSDLVVSDICIGTMTFGSNVDALAAHELLDYAYDEFGINFVDTAEIYPLPSSEDTYGRTESLLGKWLTKRGASVRSKIILATKIAGRCPELSWLRDGDCKLSKTNILKAVDACLLRLNTDYIDLLQFHWPDRYVPMHRSGDFEEVLFSPERMDNGAAVDMEEQVDAIRELLKQGKIRAWGVSNETPYGLLKFWKLCRDAGISPPSSVQLNYNLLCRNDVEKGFVELCRPQNTGISLLAYGPLAGGILTGKYLEYVDTTTCGRLLRFPSYMSRYRGSLAARSVKEYYDIAMWYKYPNLCAIALRWVLTRPFVCSTIIGVSDFYQLRENLHCLNPSLGMTDLMERQINQLHWKWRDSLRICQ